MAGSVPTQASCSHSIEETGVEWHPVVLGRTGVVGPVDGDIVVPREANTV